MYPRAFHYHRAASLKEASTMLLQLGEEAKLLAGGQSLIPLMKLRFASPKHLVDLNFISGTSYIKEENGALRFGALTRHAEVEYSASAAKLPILHDCASGIADVQVRNRGTIGGSLAEADPSGDWATVLMTLETEVRCLGTKGERIIPLPEFIRDAYTTALLPDEVLSEVIIKVPPRASGGAYLAFKRSAPVYPTASAAVRLTMEGDVCKEAAIVLGCVGLTPIKSNDAETALRGQRITEKAISAAVESARAAADPQSDMRGSAEYKRTLVGTLVKRAIEIAVQRAGGKQVEVSHIYA
ncbi:MAG: carbon monoxide dehydrogenase [Acidobacteria bacterium]|jgi:carbon-monoxide dehydrogenase medium subunit|nr:MAG: carbon monoxide dehydrogenase [Acidobacteriota bacterium]